MVYFNAGILEKTGSGKKNIFGYKACVQVILVILLLLTVQVSNAQTAAYIKRHKKMAQTYSRQYNIPVGVILSVAVVESSSGRGDVARRYHNHFGVVGKNRHTKSKSKKRSRYKEYANTAASYRDFCEIVSRKQFYSRLKGTDNCKAWITAISHTGYSEHPAEWSKRVEHVLVGYHL